MLSEYIQYGLKICFIYHAISSASLICISHALFNFFKFASSNYY